MYLLIDRHYSCVGIFSTKKKMRMVVEYKIKREYEKTGEIGGNYHFRYIKFKPDEAWFTDGNPHMTTLYSLSTMHPEKFDHEIETDWKTGKVLKV